MSAANAFIAIELLFQSITTAARLKSILEQARAEGRDVSAEELRSVRQTGDTLMIELDKAIATAEAEGR